MKKYMIADLKKSLDSDRAKELGINWPLKTDVDYEVWWNEKNIPISIEFTVHPSRAGWKNNMHDSPADITTDPDWESIGPEGDDTPYYYVSMNFPEGSTEAPEQRTYYMDIDTLEAWSEDTSGTYYNANIRGKYLP